MANANTTILAAQPRCRQYSGWQSKPNQQFFYNGLDEIQAVPLYRSIETLEPINITTQCSHAGASLPLS